jgi:hypothetical protein
MLLVRAAALSLFCMACTAAETPANAAPAAAPPAAAAPKPETEEAQQARTGGVGQADTARGESRRNENVQINLVDTNAARELNSRVGTTATIVEEFRPERGYFSTEYGNAVRNPLHAQPQRGSGVHGNLFWNHNNSIFSARSFFQVGSVQPARQNQYGVALNTGLWKDGFFSLNASQDKNRGMVNGNVLIPLLSERTSLATDPATRAAVERLLGAYPLVAPNRPDIAARALNTNAPQTVNTSAISGQLNQRLNQKDTFIARYGFNGQNVNAFQFVKGQNPNTMNKTHTARATWNRAVSATTVLDVSAGFDRTGTLLMPTADSVGPIFLNGLQMLGPQSNVPLDRSINLFKLSAGLQHRRNKHALTFGFGTTRQHYNGYETEGSRPTFQFRDDFGRDMIANLRLGTPSTFSQSFGIYSRSFRNYEFQGYAGDRWAVSNKLTVNYGVRWEPWTLPQDAMGLSKLPFHSDWNNFGGNFGFALRLPKGVIRGAWGTMTGQLFPIAYGQDRFNTPYSVNVGVQAPDLVNPTKNLTAADLNGTGRSVGFAIDPNLATPYSHQYNFSWENDFNGWKLQLGYVGSRALKLFQTYQFNRGRPVEGLAFTTATVNLRRADQKYFQRFYTANSSRAYYDAARVNLTLPRYRGATVVASYWFSKSIDLGSDYAVTGGGQERWGQAGQTELGVATDQKGLSNFDQPHALLLQSTWDSGRRGGNGLAARLTRNWQLAGVLLLKSGTPFGVDSGSDSPGFGNADGSNGDRPNLLDPSILGRTIGNPDTAPLLLPRSAFAYFQAPAQMRGNIGRNVFRKGKIANLNASVARTWALRSDWTMMLRAEAINLSNTPQFADPGKSLTSPNFGQITNTLNDGRTFRFSLRLGF